MLLDGVEVRINELASEPVKLCVYKGETKVDSHNVRVLVSSTDIPSQRCTETEIVCRGDDSGTEYCRARYLEFLGKQVAYIDWIWVHKDIRGNGVGRLIRRTVVEMLSHVEAIYSKIENDKLIGVAIDQGFRQIGKGNLEGWFVRE